MLSRVKKIKANNTEHERYTIPHVVALLSLGARPPSHFFEASAAAVFNLRTTAVLTARKLRHPIVNWQVQQYVLLSWCQQKTYALCIPVTACRQFFTEISFFSLLLRLLSTTVLMSSSVANSLADPPGSSRSIYRISQKKVAPKVFWHFSQNGWKFLVQFYTPIVRFCLRWTRPTKFCSIICSFDEVMPLYCATTIICSKCSLSAERTLGDRT